MPTYRYYTTEILPVGSSVSTLPPIVELEGLYGVYMDKQLGVPGNFTATFRLSTHGPVQDAALINGTTPGRYALVCIRRHRGTDVIVWSGPLWSRTWNAPPKTVQLTAQTWESVFDHCYIASNFTKNAIEQKTIFIDAVTAMQAQFGGNVNNFGFTFSPTLANTGITRTIGIAGTARRPWSDVINALTGVDGLSYSISSEDRTIRLFNEAAAYVASGMHFDYPGTITNFWFSENASRAGVDHFAMGPGEQSALATSSGFTTWPRWFESASYPDVTSQAILQAKADKRAILFKPPLPSPTYELGTQSQFDGWNKVGQSVVVTVKDERFPAGQEFTSRMQGWSLRPESGEDAPEVINISLESDA